MLHHRSSRVRLHQEWFPLDRQGRQQPPVRIVKLDSDIGLYSLTELAGRLDPDERRQQLREVLTHLARQRVPDQPQEKEPGAKSTGRQLVSVEGQPLGLTRMYLQQEGRIVGLVLPLILALRLLRALEWTARKELGENEEALKGLYPRQAGRQTKSPSAELLLRALEGISLVVEVGGQVSVRVTASTALQQLLDLWGLPADLYLRLAIHFHEPLESNPNGRLFFASLRLCGRYSLHPNDRRSTSGSTRPKACRRPVFRLQNSMVAGLNRCGSIL